MKRILILVIVLCGIGLQSSHAQTFSFSTDLVSWLNLGTINMEASAAVAKEVTINAGMKYNPWSFQTKNGQIQDRQATYHAGVRWWPWHIYSGWWFGGAFQYQEYNRGGIMSRKAEEGDAMGAAFSAGYTLMVHKNFNVEFSLGGWIGGTNYTEYNCTTCGKIIDQGRKFFVRPNDISIALMFVF